MHSLNNDDSSSESSLFPEAYRLAFKFWSLMATERETLSAGFALATPDVAYLLSNAVWFLRHEGLAEVMYWYSSRGLPPAVITPALLDDDTRAALRSAGFKQEYGFTLHSPTAKTVPPGIITEQVSWLQSRYLADLLAERYEQPQQVTMINKSLTRVLRASSGVNAFLSYVDDRPVAGALVFVTQRFFVAMLHAGDDGALNDFLLREAGTLGLKARVLRAAPSPDDAFISADGLIRWSLT